MRRLATFSTLLATVFFNGQAGNLAAYDITYDGYSDGVYLEIDQNTGLVSGFVTGAVDGDIMGVVGGVENQGRSIIISYPEDSFYEGLLTIIRDDGTWSHYFHDGAQMLELNSGTWIKGVPSVQYGQNVTSSLDVIDDVDFETGVTKKRPPGVEVIKKKDPPGVKVITKKDPPGVEVITKKDPPGVK
ncbi:MAG: hypothetical protein ACE5OP_14045 [Candidatus Glassbacteria bacterium]